MAAPSNSFSSFSWFDGTTIALFVLLMLPQRLQLRLAVAICSLSFAFIKAVGSAVVDAVKHSTSTFELHCDDSGDTALVAALLFGHGPVFGHTCWRRWCGTETPPAAAHYTYVQWPPTHTHVHRWIDQLITGEKNKKQKVSRHVLELSNLGTITKSHRFY